MENQVDSIINGLKYIDLTEELDKLTKTMKQGELIKLESFSLYDSMSGTELGDPKMDIKQGLDMADTPQKLLEEKKIKLGSELSIQELSGIFDQIIIQQMIWMEGHALSHSIYQISYLFDEKLYKDNILLKAFIETLYFMGNNLYDLCRYSPYLREDDYVLSVFGFPQTNKTFQEISTLITEALESISDKITNPKKKKAKKNIKLNEYDGVHGRLQIQQIILEISMILCEQKFNQGVKEKLEKYIKLGRQYLEDIQKTEELSQNMENIKSSTIYKTIVAQISPRKVFEKSVKEAYESIENMFKYIEYIFEIQLQTDMYSITHMLNGVHSRQKNTCVKAYLDITILQNNYLYFESHNYLEFICTELQNYGLTSEQIQSENVQKHVQRLYIVQQEIITKHLKNRYRQQREFPKIHQDLNIIIHEASLLDNEYIKNTPQSQALVVQAYDMGIRLMIKQIQLGQELNLYEDADQPQVLFYQEYLFSILEKNQIKFIVKFDKDFIQSYSNKTNLDKKKKKLTDFQRQFFYNYIFSRGVQLYLKALSKLSYLLFKNKSIENFNDEEEYKNRFNKRFNKIFNNIYYIKCLDYDKYVEYQEDFWNGFSNFEQGLENVQGLFKEAIEQFISIPQNDSVISDFIKSEAKTLNRVCVTNSLSIFTIKANLQQLSQYKTEYSIKEHSTYPTLSLVKRK